MRRRVLSTLFLIVILTLSFFVSLTNVQDSSAVGRRLGWNSRTEYVVQNINGSYTSTFYIGPQVFYNATTDVYNTLKFVVNPSGMSQQNVRFFLENSQISIELTDQAATLFNPDYTQLCVASEMWTVEYLQSQWRDTGIGTATPTWTYQNDSQSVNVTRTQTISGAGQLNITYSLRAGQFLKHTVSYRADISRSNYRIAMHLDGIASNHVKTNNGNTYNVNGETHVYADGFVVGSNDQNLVYQENLASIFNQTNSATTGNLTDIVFNTGSNGMKADFYIGTWNLPVNGILGIDPSTSTYSISSTTNDGYASCSTLTTGQPGWDYVHDNATGIAAGTGTCDVTTMNSTGFDIYRGFIRFTIDRSEIQEVTSAILTCTSRQASDNGAIAVYNWTTADASITTATYSKFNSTCVGLNTTTGLALNAPYLITINDTSVLSQSLIGFCLREYAHDALDIIEPSITTKTIYDYGLDPTKASTLTLTYTPKSNAEHYVNNNSSNVDASASVGTQSNFTAQQYGPDLTNDTLTEANGASITTTELWVNGFTAANVAWTEVGSAPYLGANDYNSNYIWCTSGQGSLEDRFNFSDTGTVASVASVTLCVYANTGGGNDGFSVYLWNSSAMQTVATSQTGGSGFAWYNYTVTATLPSKSEIDSSQMRLAYYYSGSSDDVFVDGALLRVEYYASYNYRLDLEEQWTNVNYTRANEQLCIYAGPRSGTEDLMVYAWNGTWNFVMNLTANQWNNASVTDWLTSDTFTIRLLDGLQSSDTSADNWQIDCALLHTWETTGASSSFTLTETSVFTSALYSNKALGKILSQTITSTSSLTTQKGLINYLSQTLTVGSSSSAFHGMLVYLLVSSAISSSIASQKNISKIAAENIAANSNLNALKALLRTLSENSATSANAAVIRGALVSLLETATVTDNIAVRKALIQILVEALTSTSSATVQKTLAKYLAESTSTNSNLSGIRGIIFALLESLDITDVSGRVIDMNKLLTGVASSSDAVTTQRALVKLLVELANISDNLYSSVGVTVNELEVVLSGTGNITDAFTVQKALSKFLTDTAAITESSTINKALVKILSDLASSSDDFDYSIGIFVNALEVLLTEGSTTTDNLTVQKELIQLLSQTINATDSSTGLKTLARLLAESISTDSNLDYNIGLVEHLLEIITSDTATIDEQLAAQKELTKLLSQTITATDSLDTQKGIAQQFLEFVLSGTAQVAAALDPQWNIIVQCSDGISAGMVQVLSNLDWGLEISAFFQEFLNTIRVTDLVTTESPLMMVSIDTAMSYAVIGAMLSCVTLASMFLLFFKRKRRRYEYFY